MKYNIKQLIDNKAENKFIFFWGHRASADGNIAKTCFSQWWESPFAESGILYKTAEHYMMAKKAELFKDTEIQHQIIAATTPAEVKKLGRLVKNYDDEIWLANRYAIVLQGNYLKFSQNKELKNLIINTGHRIIVEASPVDMIWGIGMAADNPEIYFPEKWKGLNLLGFALMEVRDLLSVEN